VPVIDLFAGLREVSSTRGATGGGGISKVTLEVRAPSFKIDLNESQLAGAMAVAVVEQVRANILAGRRLDGSPAAPLAASTIERREYRILQAQRGGAAADRYRDRKFRSEARKNHRKRFTAPRLGSFSPADSPAPITTRGIESGLLLKSMVAEPTSAGGWKIFFANVRAQTDRSGNSPVGRAFGLPAQRAAMFERLVSQPSVRKRLEHSLQAAVNGKRGPNLLAELERTANLAHSLGAEMGG
jgi:hypothetical protein